MSKPRVLVIGDAILDVVSQVQTTRLAPESPLPVFVQTDSDRYRPGGAGNVALNAASMGAQTLLVYAETSGDASLKFAYSLENCDGRLRSMAIPGLSAGDIPVKRRSFQDSRMVYREDREGLVRTESTRADRLVENAYAEMDNDVPVVVLSDYGKGFFDYINIDAVIAECKARGSLVLVDPKPGLQKWYTGCDILKPNEDELLAMAGYLTKKNASLAEAANSLMETGSYQNIVITRGARGVRWERFTEETPYRKDYATRASRVFDVCGAGDSFLAAMALELSVNPDIDQAIRRAQLAASIAISYPGTVAVSDLEYRLAKAEHENQSFRVVDADTARRIRYFWQARGDRVVFTNGCFDILHPGHLYLLEKARQQGTRLIVGLNTDASIRRVKGPNRPKCHQAWRAELLASLQCVDLVVLFDEDTPWELLKELKPDVLVKDETAANAAGELPESSLAAETVLVPRLPEHSTTAFLERVPM